MSTTTAQRRRAKRGTKIIRSKSPVIVLEQGVLFPGLALPKDKPKEPAMTKARLRAKARWSAFMNLKEVCPDLSFEQFLTAPEFARHRETFV